VAGLQSVSAGNLNIGHSGAGSITTGADVTLSGVGSLVLESGRTSR
jgi:hypothetical protein